MHAPDAFFFDSIMITRIFLCTQSLASRREINTLSFIQLHDVLETNVATMSEHGGKKPVFYLVCSCHKSRCNASYLWISMFNRLHGLGYSWFSMVTPENAVTVTHHRPYHFKSSSRSTLLSHATEQVLLHKPWNQSVTSDVLYLRVNYVCLLVGSSFI
jgi:hypothetical protein